MEKVIVTKNLTKRYGSFTAVNNVDLSVSKGSVYGFIGRNGAGKTTLMKMLLGMANVTSGSFEILGASSGKDLEEARRKVGSIIETPTFYDDMTLYQNLKYRALLIGEKDKSKIDEVLGYVGLSDKRNKKVKSLSLGMRQRLGIASALLGDPEILLLDEPINGLDPVAIKEVRDTLEKLKKERNITIFISSHILGEMEKIATEYGFVNHGKLIKQITKEELEKSGKTLEDYFVSLLGGEK